MMRRLIMGICFAFGTVSAEGKVSWLKDNWATLAEYYCSFSNSLQCLRLYHHMRMNEHLPDASQQATDFVREQLKLQNVPQWQSVKVKISNNYEASGSALVTIKKSDDPTKGSALDTILEQSKNGATQELRDDAHRLLNMGKAIIRHEGEHLVHNDAHTRLFTYATLPLATFIGSIYLEKFIAGLLPKSMKPEKSPRWLSNSYKLVKGCARMLINQALLLKLSRAQELRADNAIAGDKKLLRAFRDWLYAYNGLAHEHIKEKYGPEVAQVSRTNRAIYEIIHFTIDPAHPSLLTRIKNIEERITELEQGGGDNATALEPDAHPQPCQQAKA